MKKLLFIALMLLSSLSYADWFQYFEVYAGIDHYQNQSPQCENRATTNLTDNNQDTSNMGFVANIYQSKWVDFGVKGTHFSCVWNHDRNTVNNLGIVLSKRWSR